jgi:hypothetical protein
MQNLIKIKSDALRKMEIIYEIKKRELKSMTMSSSLSSLRQENKNTLKVCENYNKRLKQGKSNWRRKKRTCVNYS